MVFKCCLSTEHQGTMKWMKWSSAEVVPVGNMQRSTFESLSGGLGLAFMTLLLYKGFQHPVKAHSATKMLWIPQTKSLIILPPPPPPQPPISAPFLYFSIGTWLMCTLPLVVFLIASTPAQSAHCINAHIGLPCESKKKKKKEGTQKTCKNIHTL